MANAALTPHDIPASISERLAGLRRKLTFWFLIEGLGRVLLWTLVIFAIDFVIDWGVHLERSQRSVLWLLMAAALAVLIYRKILVPLTSYVGDDALLLQVEKKHKDLGESVISAAQFSRISDVERMGVSRSMVDATIRHGVEQAGRVNFGDVINASAGTINMLLLVVALALCTGLGVGIATSPLLRIWFERNLLLADTQWPQRTYLEIHGLKDGVVQIPRGENWTQIVTVREDSEVVPVNVFVEFAGFGRPPQAMKHGEDERSFETVFTNVIEEFQFRVRGGDALSPKIQVRLVEPPAFDKLTMEVKLPAYAGSVVEELPPGKGPYYVIIGSELNIRGQANKELSAAALVIEPDLQALVKRSMVTTADTQLPSIADLQNKFGSPTLRLELKLADSKSAESKSVEGQLAPWLPKSSDKPWAEHVAALLDGLKAAPALVPGKYTLELTDAGGLTSKRPATFVVMVKEDREPRLNDARLVGVSGMIVPKAIVHYTARVLDDYSVTKVQLAYRARGEDFDAPELNGALPIASLADKLPAKSLKVEDALEVSELKLAPGSSLTLYIEATDNDAVNVSGPKTGKSADFAMRIVTEEQLRTDLLRREKEQRQEFERILKNQEDLITDLAALAAGVAGTANFTDEQRLQLMAVQKRQNLVATNTGGVATVLEAITTEVINNRLEEAGGKLESRLREKIIAPMRRIAEQQVDDTVLLMEKARRVAETEKERDAALVAAQEQQQEIIASMKDILANMAKAEGYQEAINLLYELEKAQKEVFERTQREKAERNKRALENGGKVEEEKPGEAKPTETKPTEGEKPTEDKPAEDKPAPEKPSDEKPGEEKTSEEKPADAPK